MNKQLSLCHLQHKFLIDLQNSVQKLSGLLAPCQDLPDLLPDMEKHINAQTFLVNGRQTSHKPAECHFFFPGQDTQLW
jgi:hypothetical protein